MDLRTRVSGRAGTAFGVLLLLHILLQLSFYTTNGFRAGVDCGTGNVSGTDSYTSAVNHLLQILMLTLPLEFVITLLYLVSRWVSMALIAYAFSWTVPFLVLAFLGLSGLFIIHIVLPLVMLDLIPYWKFDEVPRVSNPLPARAPGPFQ